MTTRHGRTVLMCLIALAPAACVGPGPRADRGERENLGHEAFAGAPIEAVVMDPAPAGTAAGDPGDPNGPPGRPSSPDGGPFGVEPVVVRSAPPATVEKPETAPPEGMAMLEAKVGDINGKPIYISSFFEPIRSRLVAEAERLGPTDWRREAARIIGLRLDGLIADELLRAEALAALTPGQRQGLRAFLTTFRRDLLSENLGSAQLASRRLQSSDGQTLDQALEQKESDTLIRLTLYEEINRRVNVSWRDIQQRYEREYDRYNPPPTASFRLIRVRTDDTAALEEVTRRLNAGEPFEAVAGAPANSFQREDAGLVRAEFQGEFGEGTFFQASTLNETARTLDEGEVAGPFELGDYTAWLKLEGIEQESISLYDAQLAINQELTLERRRDEQQRYLERLIERARVSNRDEILLRLLGVAQERYGPRG